MQKTLGPT